MKLFRVFFILLSFSTIISATCSAELSKPRLAVFDFQLMGSGFETEDPGSVVAERLLSAFADDGRFEIVERWRLNGVLEERFLGKSTIVDDRTAVKIGRDLSARFMISGSILKLDNRLEINARVIDVERLVIKAEEYVKGELKDDLHELTNRLWTKINQRLPREGVVAKRNGRDVILDLGGGGVEKDARFIVLQRGKAKRDPKTGAILGYDLYQIGKISLVDVNKKRVAGVVLEEIFSGAVKKGHLVREELKERGSASTIEPENALKEGAHKIAVFPWRLKNRASSAKSILVETCARVIKASRRLTLEASYYHHPRRDDVRRIDSRAFDAIEYGADSAGRPGKDEVKDICALGAKLGVDAVLLGKMSAKKLPSDLLEFHYIHAYLIHVETGRIVEVKVKSIHGSPRDVLPGVVRDVVGRYEKEFSTAVD